jgi:uncharacterized membrane protein (DUF373 family)
MDSPSLVARSIRSFERFTVFAAGLLLILTVIVATFQLYQLFFAGLSTFSVRTISELQPAIQRVFAGVLLLLLGLELLETLKTYFTDYHFKTEVILVVAMIAVGRHIIQLDFEHTPAATLFGVAALTIGLSGSLYLVRRRPDPFESQPNQKAGTGQHG